MKGGTKIVAIVTICIILLSISFSGCFEDGGTKKSVKPGYKIIYNLYIETENKDNYSLKISYPYKWDNFLKDIEFIEGNPKLLLNETSNGTALCIKGKGNVKISAKKESQNKISELSMMKNANNDKNAFIFCQKSELENISIELEFLGNPNNENEFGYGYYISGKLIQGWQNIKVIDREV